MIQTELEALVRHESHTGIREVHRGLLRPVAVMRLDVHPVQQVQRPKHVDDPVHERCRNGDDDTTAAAQQRAEGRDERGTVLIMDMLEDREQRDDVVGSLVVQVPRKAAAHSPAAAGASGSMPTASRTRPAAARMSVPSAHPMSSSRPPAGMCGSALRIRSR
jgi:hypothetical protein